MHFVDGAGTHIGYVGDGSTGDKNVFLGSYIGDASLVTPAGRILTATAGGRVGIGTTTPQATLDVRGDIRLGSGGQYRATSSEESLRIIRGVVDGLNSDPPAVVAGRGFSVSKLSRGDYQITFDTCFPDPPTVVATAAQAYPTATVAVLSERCRFLIHVEDDLDRYFHFIAIGLR